MPLFDDLHNPGLAPDASAFFEQANQVQARPSPSVEAFRELEPDLPRREGLVLVALTRYIRQWGHAPTAYELFTWMATQKAATDLNDVRPRLTALHDKSRVVVAGRRACTVTKKSAYTWAPKERTR